MFEFAEKDAIIYKKRMFFAESGHILKTTLRSSPMKKLLTSKNLVEHMKSKGIRFNIVDEKDAQHFLENNNYYLKLAAYRENYEKAPETAENAGQYINLEFAYLQELSTIDMHLRYLILQMTLDIEHSLKVSLLNDIEHNDAEDGYHIIQKFLARDGLSKSDGLITLKKVRAHKSSDYCKGLIEKYYPYFPAWVFVELISLGELSHLCNFYNDMYDTKIGDRILLNSVRDIRNAAAHSNCLINRLGSRDQQPHRSVVDRVKKISCIGPSSRKKKLKNKFIYDFVCLLYAYNEFIKSDIVKKRRFEELNNFFEGRMLRHEDWFNGNSLICSTYDFLKKVLDNFIC